MHLDSNFDTVNCITVSKMILKLKNGKSLKFQELLNKYNKFEVIKEDVASNDVSKNYEKFEESLYRFCSKL
ncbi:hypothetical protein HK099_006959 [Clydaea vesicula]|uniref:Uncharacterized protein n=1 Tax=Clydaea vesicula TaxID=447962 RepID=A0AAD5XU06_9FUNG|nr:hypothetical protein HK099_006959 [Clydaea vesicula]